MEDNGGGGGRRGEFTLQSIRGERGEHNNNTRSLEGAAAEGAFLLLLGTGMVGAAQWGYRHLAAHPILDGIVVPALRRTCGNADDATMARRWRTVLLRCYIGLCIYLAIYVLFFVLSSILGDATYRRMSGNDPPPAEVLRVDFAHKKTHFRAQLRHDLYGTVGRIVFGLVCLIGSVAIYAGALRRLGLVNMDWSERRRSLNVGHDENDGVAAKGHREEVAEDDVEGGNNLPGKEVETNGSSSHRKALCPKRQTLRSFLKVASSILWPKSLAQRGYLMGLCATGGLAFRLNSRRWYAPVIFAYLAAHSSNGDDNGAAVKKRMPPRQHPVGSVPAPNVVFIQHESLSGSLMLNTNHGVRAMPFFQNKMKNDPDTYVFEHVRTGSGNTIDALPALMTGCLPYNNDGIKYVQASSEGRSIGYDFHRRGYRTASFSSRALDGGIKTGTWSRLFDLLTGAMERVVDPRSEGWPMENAEGCDDRRTLGAFEDWLGEIEREGGDGASNATASAAGNAPFYAQFYNFNQHYPYMKDESKPDAFPHRYFDSLATTDEFLERLFGVLERTGKLNSTIVVGSGDHGDDPFKKSYVRLTALNSNVLHTASYIYCPRHLLADESIARTLQHNTQKLTDTLDLYPTIQSLVRGGKGGYNYLAENPAAAGGCISGVDLSAVDVPDDRVVVSYNLKSGIAAEATILHGASGMHGELDRKKLFALSTRRGVERDLSLYYRKVNSRIEELKQGPDDLYVLEFGNCTSDIDPKNLCMRTEVSEEDRAYFRDAIRWIKRDATFFSEGVKTCEPVELLSSMIS